MKHLLLIAASGLALTLAGCSGAAKPKALTKLDCPATEGELTRVSAAPDGKTCAYTNANGEEVTLQIMPVKGDASQTLAALEKSLQIPPDAHAPAPTGAQAEADRAAAAAEAQREVDEAMADSHAAEAEARGDSKTVAVKGLGRVEADADGERARVDLPGIHIDADDQDAKIQIGSIKIDTDEDQATVRWIRDVRLKGEQLSRSKNGLRATFLYTGDGLPDGYRYVGYDAGGPKSGPLAVAVIRAKSKPNGADRQAVSDDVQKLVRRNGGV